MNPYELQVLKELLRGGWNGPAAATLHTMKKQKICVVGMGYVGLPLAAAFARAGHDVTGYDISEKRIAELQGGHDRTNELTDMELQAVTIRYSTDPAVMVDRDIVILAIPTPVDANNIPDLSLVENASVAVGKHLKKGAIVVYESTVYPGVTEEFCGPILEKESGLKSGTDFTLGYSPERINPGDKLHTIDRIVKIVAGQDELTTDTLVALYGSVVTAGIHRAPSIKVAEMAKAIENAQRDLNIAFINEVAMLCGRIGIPTKAVLTAAGTKWNFLRFQPGLVGGHCIGVDPYYLVEKAKQLGMATHIITAGRAVNDGMAAYVAERTAAALQRGGRALVLGMTFKEDIPDTRNSKSGEVVVALTGAGVETFVHDPFLTDDDVRSRGYAPGSLDDGTYDAVLLLVPHREYLAAGAPAILKALAPGGVCFDLKSLLDPSVFEDAGRRYLAL